MDDEIVSVASFFDPFEAERVKSQLEAEGIRVYQSGQEASGMFAGMGGAFGKVHLHVAESDLKRATAILTRPTNEEEEEEEPLPPEENRTAIAPAVEAPPESDRTAITREEPPQNELAAAAQPKLRRGWSEATNKEEDDEEDGDTLQVWTAEEYANRAWRASVIGLLACPPLPHLYSAWLLINLWNAEGELSTAGLYKLRGALLIDCLVLGAYALFFMHVFSR